MSRKGTRKMACDKLGTLTLPDDTLALYLQRIPENGRRVWKISNATVQDIPMLWEQFGYNPVVIKLGDFLPEFTFLHMQNWQVAGFLLILIGAWLIAALLRKILLQLLEHSERYRDTLHRFVVMPLRRFVFFKLLQMGVGELGLSISARVYLNESALGYLATVFLVLGIIELLSALFLSNANNQKYWSGIIRPVRTILKMIAIVVIFLLWLSDSGYDITTVLTGLGIGSIAVALAAQKTLENVIGAFTLYIAKPIQPGDFCVVGSTAGVVEEIGLRSTRIRRMDRSVVYVPNLVLSSASIENISESDFRRYQRDLHIRLGASPDQLRNLLADLRRLIATDRARGPGTLCGDSARQLPPADQLLRGQQRIQPVSGRQRRSEPAHPHLAGATRDAAGRASPAMGARRCPALPTGQHPAAGNTSGLSRLRQGRKIRYERLTGLP